MSTPRSVIAWMIIVLSLVSGWARCRTDEPEGEYLSDRLADRIVSNTQGWGELGFNTAVQPAGRPAMPLQIVDIAPFGRVMSWDPKRKTGTAASRIEEFPRVDLTPGREILPDSDGSLLVPEWNGSGCIGLQWFENRLLRQVSLDLADETSVPATNGIELEAWAGESVWQGRWVPVKARPEQTGNRLSWGLARREWPTGTQKIRWCFSRVSRPIHVKALSAFTRSRWHTVDVQIESLRERPPRSVPIELYNGVFTDLPGLSLHHRQWDTTRALSLRLMASLTGDYKADRTVLRFGLPQPGFGVAVEDVLARGDVSFGGFRITVTSGRAQTESRSVPATETLLSRVRKQPDQTLERALALVHNPVQDLGPMMISLACDNRKFVVQREGEVLFNSYGGPDDPPVPMPEQWQLVPRYGTGASLKTTRHLHCGWLPMPVITAREDGVVYRQTTYVAPLGEPSPGSPRWVHDRAAGVVEFSVKNEGAGEIRAQLALRFAGKSNPPIEIRQTHQNVLVTTGGRILAAIDSREAAPLEVTPDPTGVTLTGRLPVGKEARCVVLLPAWKVLPGQETSLMQGTPWAVCCEAYWNHLLEPAMQVVLPDEFLTNLIRASQVHCMLAARSEDRGRRVAPWISSDRYGPLESEANSVIRGMDLLGQTDFARRGLDFFIKRYNPKGFLTTGYTLVGTGEHLWTLAEHVDRTQDRAWLKQIAPDVARVCGWIAQQRAGTQGRDARGQRVPESGLMPPGVSADWNRYAFRFFNDAQYCAGLASASRVLADCGHPAAAGLAEDARQYQADLLAAFHWTQARAPVLWLENGTWAPAQPAMLDCFGKVEEFLPGEDGNRSWAYSVELGPHHLAALGILDPRSPEVESMLEYLEGTQFLRSGMGDYPEDRNRRDPFNFGGFAKVQPFYARVAEIHALRDDVKPFLRSYFNALASLVSRETLSFWEHFHNQGGWNKTHETGWFLCQTRMMLIQERGSDLWLAPMATDRWLRDGQCISVRNAPTRFGKVGYAIRSASARGRIDAEIQPPLTWAGLHQIVLRIRHPEGKPIRAVSVQGQPHHEFDAAAQTITLKPSSTPISVHVDF